MSDENALSARQKGVKRIVSRGSNLALAQVELFKQKAKTHFPDLLFETVIIPSAGDLDQKTPLQNITQTDFFSREIHDFLISAQADFAVHSLKDICDPDFFGNHPIAYIDRDDQRDVAIFNGDIESKIQSGKTITIGSCSPRRTFSAYDFFPKALPQLSGSPIQIDVKNLRGNVDSRLQKLSDGEFDGIILALAGINRLLGFPPSASRIQAHLEGKKIMVLPLVECTPAPCQATIVVETRPGNSENNAILEALHQPEIARHIEVEKTLEAQFRVGPKAAFGAFSLPHGDRSFAYASGENERGEAFSAWKFDAPDWDKTARIFSVSNFMKDFFDAEKVPVEPFPAETKAIYVAHQKAVDHYPDAENLRNFRLWTSGTHSWFALAKRGFWVEGCTDGFGLDFLKQTFSGPVVDLKQAEISLLTNESGAEIWKKEGWKTVASYRQIPAPTPALQDAVRDKDVYFWTNFNQFELVKKDISKTAIHCTLPGKTAQRFLENHIVPRLFPSVKAFKQWSSNPL